MGNKLYVGNLSFNVTEEALSDVFAQCGQVASVRIITDRDSGRSKGFGFVEMSDENEAQAAIEKFNGAELEGRALRISEAKPQETRPSGGGFGGNRGGGSRGGFGGNRGGGRGRF